MKKEHSLVRGSGAGPEAATPISMVIPWHSLNKIGNFMNKSCFSGGETTRDDDMDSEDFSRNDDDSSVSVVTVDSRRVRKRRRLKLESTAQYIYEKLFVDGYSCE